MSRKLILIGSGEFAQIAFEYFSHDSPLQVEAFVVEREFIKHDTLCDRPVFAYEDVLNRYPPEEFLAFVAVPASQLNRLRMRFYLDLKSKGYGFASYISSAAFVWRNAVIGENSFIFENNVIQPFVSIGNNCVIWSGNHIGHRTNVGDHTFISSHVVISGYCDIGEGSFIGVNATLNDNIRVGRHCVIGSGALVVKNTDPERVYVGQPAKAVPNKSSFEIPL